MGIPFEEIIIGGDSNGHVRQTSGGFESFTGFWLWRMNEADEHILNSVIAYGMMLTNTFFSNKESYYTTFATDPKL